MGHPDEAISILRDMIPAARRGFGPNHDFTIRLDWRLGEALVKNSYRDRPEGLAVLRDASQRAQRILGPAHPVSRHIEEDLQNARELPRFSPGTRVECKYEGRFCKGTVVGNYYREPDFEPDYFAPYQVQLDDADGGDLIWMPDDDDEYVRAAASESSDGPVDA